MEYIIKFKEDAGNNYFLLSDIIVKNSGVLVCSYFTMYELEFPTIGEVHIHPSNKTVLVTALFQDCYIVFTAIDITQLISFFMSQNIKMIPAGIISDTEAQKFIKLLQSKKSNLVTLGK